jgi:signal peptidase II
VLVAVALVIVTVLMIWLSKTDRLRLGLALGLVIGGAIGNVIDRLRFGAVFDFLDVHAFGFHWPAFNVADSAITVGALALVADSLFGHPEGRKVESRERQGQGR